jgi:hypothetical protein
MHSTFRNASQPGRPMILQRCLAVFLLLGASLVANASQVIRFSSDRASVPLPESFRVVITGDDVVATFGENSDHTVEISLLAALSKPGGAQDLALAFVKAQGEKKGANVLTDGERATFSEPGAKQKRGSKVYQAMHWQIGVGNCVFTMTLTAPLPMSKELDDFLGEPLNTIVNKLSCGAR